MQQNIYSGEDPVAAIRDCYQALLSMSYRNRLQQSTRGGNWILSPRETEYLSQMISDMQSVMAATYNGTVPMENSAYRSRIVEQGNIILGNL